MPKNVNDQRPVGRPSQGLPTSTSGVQQQHIAPTAKAEAPYQEAKTIFPDASSINVAFGIEFPGLGEAVLGLAQSLYADADKKRGASREAASSEVRAKDVLCCPSSRRSRTLLGLSVFT